MRHFLIRTRATPLWFPSGFVRETADTELWCFLPNGPQFGERTTFSRQKALQTFNCGFTRRSTAARPSKCGTHGGRKAAHMVPHYHVPLQCVCYILFYVYHMCYHGTIPFVGNKVNGSTPKRTACLLAYPLAPLPQMSPLQQHHQVACLQGLPHGSVHLPLLLCYMKCK